MVSKYSKSELNILKQYVDSNDLEEDEYEVIKRMVLSNPPVSMTVYRGQNGTRHINSGADWFSTTTNKQVALKKFTNSETNCCLFTIHLINVQALLVNKSGIVISSKDRSSEDEVIVLGGGTFYKNEHLTEEGFDDLMDGEYECWYTFPKDKDKDKDNIHNEIANRASELFTKLDPEEYEFIDTKDDVKIFLDRYNITDLEANDVFNMIDHIKNRGAVGGKKRKPKQKKRSRKAKKRLRKSRRQTKRRY